MDRAAPTFLSWSHCWWGGLKGLSSTIQSAENISCFKVYSRRISECSIDILKSKVEESGMAENFHLTWLVHLEYVKKGNQVNKTARCGINTLQRILDKSLKDMCVWVVYPNTSRVMPRKKDRPSQGWPRMSPVSLYHRSRTSTSPSCGPSKPNSASRLASEGQESGWKTSHACLFYRHVYSRKPEFWGSTLLFKTWTAENPPKWRLSFQLQYYGPHKWIGLGTRIYSWINRIPQPIQNCPCIEMLMLVNMEHLMRQRFGVRIKCAASNHRHYAHLPMTTPTIEGNPWMLQDQPSTKFHRPSWL